MWTSQEFNQTLFNKNPIETNLNFMFDTPNNLAYRADF